MSEPSTYRVIRAADWDFTPPSQGDQSRGVMRLSDQLDHSRANIWRMPPATRGRRHRETTQEEIFVALDGEATLLVGEPAHAVTLPPGTLVVVKPRTPVQLANLSGADAIVLIIGAPATVADAEYLPEATQGSG